MTEQNDQDSWFLGRESKRAPLKSKSEEQSLQTIHLFLGNEF
jgi:hypothetical protein